MAGDGVFGGVEGEVVLILDISRLRFTVIGYFGSVI